MVTVGERGDSWGGDVGRPEGDVGTPGQRVTIPTMRGSGDRRQSGSRRFAARVTSS